MMLRWAALAGLMAAAWMETRPERTDGRIVKVAASADGQSGATATADGRVRVRDRGWTARAGGAVNDLQFSPDGRWLAVADRGLLLIDMDGVERVLRRDGANYGSVRFRADGGTVVTVTGRGSIETIDAATGATRWRVCCATIYGDAAFTPDGTAVVSAGHWPAVWDAATGALLGRLTKDRQEMTFGPIGFDGSGRVYMGSQDGRVWAWDWRSRAFAGRSEAQLGYVDRMAVVTNGVVIYGSAGGPPRWWQLDGNRAGAWADARVDSNLAVTGETVLFGTSDTLRSIPVIGANGFSQ